MSAALTSALSASVAELAWMVAAKLQPALSARVNSNASVNHLTGRSADSTAWLAEERTVVPLART